MELMAYILIIMMVIFVLVGGFMIISTVIELHTLGNRVEDSLIASGWAGFKEIDFDTVAKRAYISDEEAREIFLDKTVAQNTVVEYIKDNLKLDAALYPKGESYLPYKDHPVIIDEITIYNPDDLPSDCSFGVNLIRTTIHMDVSIPVEIKFLGLRHLKKHVDVDIKSFYID